MRKITLNLFLALAFVFTWQVNAQLTEGFEGENFPPAGWAVFDNGIGTTQSWTTNSSAHTGSKAAFMRYEGGNLAQDWLATSLLDLSASVNAELRFFTKQAYAPIYNNIYEIRVSAGSQVDVADYTIVQSWDDNTLSSPATTYTEKIVDLSAYDGQLIYIAFVMTNDNGDSWYVDDVSVADGPTCPAPSNLAVSNVTTVSADLEWTDNSIAAAWDIEYGVSGFAPTGVPTNAGVTTNPYNLTGLSASTAYQYYVRASCSAEDASVWVGPFAFTTSCGSISSFPYLESFETITSGQPNCWSIEGTTTNATQHFVSYVNGQTGRGMRFNSYSNSNGNTSELITPTFDASGMSSLELKFFYKNATGGNFEVLVSSDNGATYTSLETDLTGQSSWMEKTYSLTSYISDELIIKFKGTSNYGSGDAYINLDEILVREAPSCVQPTELTVDAILATSADIGWVAGGTETLWNIELVDVTAGDTVTGTATALGVSNPYALTNLTANNTYAVYVQSDCGAGDSSEWTGPLEFTTLCSAVSEFPFLESFETITSGQPDCWSIEGTTTNAAQHFVSYVTGQTGRGMRFNSYSNSNGNTSELITPTFDASGLSSLELKFFYKNATGGNFEVLVSSDNGATYISLETDLTGQSSWIEKTYNLTSYISDELIIKFKGTSNYGSGDAYINLDEVLVREAPSCVQPIDLSADAITATSANLSWTSSGSEALWNVELVDITAGDTVTGVATDLGVSNPFALTDLTPNNDYVYYVQADCGGGDSSEWSGPFAFATPCLTIADFPYLESFEAITSGQPDCWSVEGTTSSSTQHFSSYASGQTGRGMRFNSYTNTSGNTSELITPMFDASALASLELKFFYMNPTGGNFEVLVSDDGGDTYTSLETGLIGQSEWIEMTYNLTTYVSDQVVIKFKGTSNYGPSGAYIDLDEVALREIPSCLEPSALSVANVTTTTADLLWIAGDAEVLWDIELVNITAGDSATGVPTVSGVTNPYLSTDLVESNSYEFYVRADCGSSDLSLWVGPFAFETACEATNIPYALDFQASVSTPICTQITNEGTGSRQWEVVAESNSGFTPNHLKYRYDSSHAANSWFFTQGINLTAGQTYTISYDYGCASSYFDEALKVAYGTSATSAEMTNVIADYPSVVNTTPNSVAIELTVPTTGVYYFGFHAYSAANKSSLYLDNIAVDESLGVNDSKFTNFSYYPNPVTNTLTLKAQKDIQDVAVYNMLGQEVIRKRVNAVSGGVDMSTLQSGAYFVKVTIEDATQTIKIVKN